MTNQMDNDRAVVGMARCAVPVAERSVRRRNRVIEPRILAPVPPVASFRAGTAQRNVPTIQEPGQAAPKNWPDGSGLVFGDFSTVMGPVIRHQREISVTAKKLLEWYSRNARDLPWRRTLDPYAVWASEIMSCWAFIRL